MGAKLDDEVQFAVKKYSILEQELENVQNELDKAKGCYAAKEEVDEELTWLQKSHTNLEKDLDEVTKKLEETTANLTASEAKVAELEAEGQSLHRRIQIQEMDLTRSEEMLDLKSVKEEANQEKLSEAELRASAAESNVTRLDGVIETLEQELVKEREKYQTLCDDLEAAYAELVIQTKLS